MKKIFKLIKNICVGIFAIYSINILFSSVGLNIPINIFSILISSVFGLVGIITLILLLIIV